MEENKNIGLLSLRDWSKSQEDTIDSNQNVIDEFVNECNKIEDIKAHRDFIEESQFRFNIIYGHWHRSLQYLWKLLVDEMPQNFSFLEIGVYKGQILSLIQMLANPTNKNSKIFGVTSLIYQEFAPYDRGPFIINIYKQFNLDFSNTAIYNGRSQVPNVISAVKQNCLFDMVYIDGDHSYAGTRRGCQSVLYND